MAVRNHSFRIKPLLVVALLSLGGTAVTTRYLRAQATATPVSLEPGFEQYVKPFFNQNCMACHNADTSTAGIRVDQLDPKLEDRHIQVWEAIRRRVKDGTMPPKGMPQPSS